MPLNRALKLAIVGSGLPQKEVARRAKMDMWRLSRIVHQDVQPLPGERRRLARILRAPVDTLFTAEVVQ